MAACVYLLVVEEPAELTCVGGFEVPEALRIELLRRFDVRLSVRDLFTVVERLVSAGALCIARTRRNGDAAPVLVTSTGADAEAAEIEAVAEGVRSGTIDPVAVAGVIAGLGRPGFIVFGRASIRLGSGVVAALVQAGVEGRIDARALAAAGLDRAVEGRRKTLLMRRLGAVREYEQTRRTWYDEEMEGREIERRNSRGPQSLTFIGADEPVDLDAPIGAAERVSEAGDANGSRPMTIAQAVVAALRAHPVGLTRAEIPDAASAAAGMPLKPISVTS